MIRLSRLTRREFLEITGITATAVTFAGCGLRIGWDEDSITKAAEPPREEMIRPFRPPRLHSTQTPYEIIEAVPQSDERSLIHIHGERDIVASLKAFGPDYLNENIERMQLPFLHPQTGERINFREPTTAESILMESYEFVRAANPKILDTRVHDYHINRFFYHSLQLGRIVRAAEGFYVNPPRVYPTPWKGVLRPETNEDVLKPLLDGTAPIKVGKGKIYIVRDRGNLRDFGYAEYDTFRQTSRGGDGLEVGEFIESGLARVLEHTEEKTARNFGEICYLGDYPHGIYIEGFDSIKLDWPQGFIKRPEERVAALETYDGLLRLTGEHYDYFHSGAGVPGGGWANGVGIWGDDYGSFVFGILAKSTEGASQGS